MRLPSFLLVVLAMLPARAAAAETRVDATEGMMLIAGQEPADALSRALPLARTHVLAEVTGFASQMSFSTNGTHSPNASHTRGFMDQ